MSKNFNDELDTLGKALMTAAKGTKTDLSDKIAIFSNMVKWAAIKNKIEPDDGGEGSGWAKYGRVLNNGAGRAGNAPAETSAKKGKRAHAPVDDRADAAEDRAIAEAGSARHSNIDGLELTEQDTRPPFGSFPVVNGSIHIGNTGSPESGNNAPDSGSNV